MDLSHFVNYTQDMKLCLEVTALKVRFSADHRSWISSVINSVLYLQVTVNQGHKEPTRSEDHN